MSLIHQALRDMEPPLVHGAAAMAPQKAPRPRLRSRAPLLAALAMLGIALASFVAWRSWSGGASLQAISPAVSAPAMLPAATAAPLPVVATAPLAAVASPPEPAATVVPTVPAAQAAAGRDDEHSLLESPGAHSVAARRAATPAGVQVADAAAVPQIAPVQPAAVPKPPRLPRPPTAAAPAPTTPTAAAPAVRVPAATASPMSAEQHFNQFLLAMRNGDLPGAERHLVALRAGLPQGSVSLLRAEGWHAMARDDRDGAARHYQAILDRLPGDEEASVNLASIELRRQRTEPARQILADALRMHPESEALKSALAGFRSKP